MDKLFEYLSVTRKNILAELEACPTEALFEIPKPFNNNILWNAIHVIVTQQLLVYANTNSPFRIDQSIIEKYKKGTVPTQEANLDMMAFVKAQLLTSVIELKDDYDAKIFGEYTPVTTSYNTRLESVEDAIKFINLHDAMHYGQIKMIRKMLEQ